MPGAEDWDEIVTGLENDLWIWIAMISKTRSNVYNEEMP